MAPKRKSGQSAVWNYFDIKHNLDGFAWCIMCEERLKRGQPGKPSSYSTKSLWDHLESKHRDSHDKAKKHQADDQERTRKRNKEQEDRLQKYFISNQPRNQKLNEINIEPQPSTSGASSGTAPLSRCTSKVLSPSQQTLTELFNQSKKFEKDDPAQLAGEQKLLYWLVDGMMPYATVENPRFRDWSNFQNKKFVMPSEKKIRTKLLPELNAKVQHHIRESIMQNDNECFSLTTDIWTSPSADSFMSLTVHWINENFEQKIAVLRCVPYNKSHTAQNLSSTIKGIANDWGLKNIHCVLRDNAINVVQGVILAGFKGQGCFCHILNLIVKHAVLERDGVIHTLLIRLVVSHVHIICVPLFGLNNLSFVR